MKTRDNQMKINTLTLVLLLGLGAGLSGLPAQAAINPDNLGVITSYSIHYTKLYDSPHSRPRKVKTRTMSARVSRNRVRVEETNSATSSAIR